MLASLMKAIIVMGGVYGGVQGGRCIGRDSIERISIGRCRQYICVSKQQYTVVHDSRIIIIGPIQYCITGSGQQVFYCDFRYTVKYTVFIGLKGCDTALKGGNTRRSGTRLHIWVQQDQCQESQQYQQSTKRDRSISTDLNYQIYSEFIDVLYLLNHSFQSFRRTIKNQSTSPATPL